jgi:hypothetical protein
MEHVQRASLPGARSLILIDPMSDAVIRDRLREVLVHDWDPTNVEKNPHAHSAYDAYLGPLLDLIRSGADEAMMVEFLHEREKEIMCFPSLGTERLKRVAAKLIGAVRG